jgi:hypothetical protein
MSIDVEHPEPRHARGRRPVSIPFIVGVVFIAPAVYFAAPWLMTRFLLLGEQQKAAAVKAPEQFAELSELARSLQENSENAWEGMSVGLGGDSGSSRSSGDDPESHFAAQDKDGNGKLEGEEISRHWSDRLEQLDSDGDGAISKQEFLAAESSGFNQSNGSYSIGKSVADSEEPSDL